MNKHIRYRQKNIAQGRCPHCGELCAPFYECEQRRAYKRLKYKNRQMKMDKELLDEIQYYMEEDGLCMKNDYIQAVFVVCFLMPQRKPVASRICKITGLDFSFVRTIIGRVKQMALERYKIKYDWLEFDYKAELVEDWEQAIALAEGTD
jgi:uncharacterized protein YacL (UPF0231 family)